MTTVGRTILIGDLHGCAEEAEDLLKLLSVTPGDRVIFLGDLVDRGPWPRECVELAMRHECLLGNHEEKHLRQQHSAPEKLKPDHLRTRAALDERHFEWFRRLPLFVRLPEHGAAAVHAGMLPGVPVEAQPARILLHGQHLVRWDTPETAKSFWPSKAPPEAVFWTRLWRGPERVIFGHTVLNRPLVLPYAVGIDSGCVHGWRLTACVLPGWEIVSVPARRPHRERHRMGHYPIDDGVHTFS